MMDLDFKKILKQDSRIGQYLTVVVGYEGKICNYLTSVNNPADFVVVLLIS